MSPNLPPVAAQPQHHEANETSGDDRVFDDADEDDERTKVAADHVYGCKERVEDYGGP